MLQKKWILGVSSMLVVILMLAGYFAIAAEYGSKTDPMVALSYIRDELMPNLSRELQAQVNAKASEAVSELDKEYDRLKTDLDAKAKEFEQKYASSSNDEAFTNAVADIVVKRLQDSQSSGSSVGYTKLTVEKGKTVKAKIGTEIVLRLGSCSVVAGASPGLVDLTSAGSINNGQALSANHLYIVTIEGHGFKATESATLFIRGGYTLE